MGCDVSAQVNKQGVNEVLQCIIYNVFTYNLCMM